MAMAEYLGPSRLSLDQWAQFARERGVPPVVAEPDLFAPAPIKIATKPACPACNAGARTARSTMRDMKDG
jgi:hypothetical protein